MLLLERAFRLGDFLLTSGRRSGYYFDGRLVTLDPVGALLVGRAFLDWTRQDGLHKIGGPTLGADPIVASVALCSALDGGDQVSAFIVRKQAKTHGSAGWCAGPPPAAGESVALVDDALTTGGSLLQAAETVAAAGARVGAVYTLLDREEGGRENITAAGFKLRSLFTAAEVLGAQAASGQART